MARLVTYPERGRRVVPRKGTADEHPEVAGRVGVIVAVTGADAAPEVHVAWEGLEDTRVHARSYLLLETDPEPTYQILRHLKQEGVLSDWHQRQQGPDRGSWYLGGPKVPADARTVPWAYVQAFAAGATAALGHQP